MATEGPSRKQSIQRAPSGLLPEVPTLAPVSAREQTKAKVLASVRDPIPSLTKAQVLTLVDNLNLGPQYQNLIPEFVEIAYNYSKTIDEKRKRPFEYLDKLSKDPCAKESIVQNFEVYKSRIKEKQDALKEEPDEDERNLLAQSIKSVKNSYLLANAYVLIDGYDKAIPDNFKFDSNGNIVDIRDTDKSRFPVCLKYVQQQNAERNKWRPMPGVDGGRKKTRKRSKKSRKTLRRRR